MLLLQPETSIPLTRSFSVIFFLLLVGSITLKIEISSKRVRHDSLLAVFEAVTKLPRPQVHCFLFAPSKELHIPASTSINCYMSNMKKKVFSSGLTSQPCSPPHQGFLLGFSHHQRQSGLQESKSLSPGERCGIFKPNCDNEPAQGLGWEYWTMLLLWKGLTLPVKPEFRIMAWSGKSAGTVCPLLVCSLKPQLFTLGKVP